MATIILFNLLSLVHSALAVPTDFVAQLPDAAVPLVDSFGAAGHASNEEWRSRGWADPRVNGGQMLDVRHVRTRIGLR